MPGRGGACRGHFAAEVGAARNSHTAGRQQIVIQGVTFGTNHTFARGSKLLAKAQQHIPQAIGRWLPQPFVSSTRTARDYLIIWYSAYDPATDTYPQVNVDQLEVVDEHGCAFRVNEYGGTQSSGRFSVKTAYVEVFPRRQKTFTLRAKFAGYPTLELQVSNPLYPITAQWTPEPLPARRSTNDVAVTLKRLRPHKNSRYVGTEIDIHEKGKRRDEWYSPSVTFRDATGNSSDWLLCRHERAWKLEVDLYKTAKAPFPEPAIWRIGDVRVPQAGQVLVLTNETQIAGMWLRPIALCGPGEFVFSNDVCVSSAPLKDGRGEHSSTQIFGQDVEMTFALKRPSLIMRVDGWRGHQHLLIRGQPVADGGDARTFQFRSSGGNLCRFEMEKAGSEAVFNLEFIPQEPLHFQFVVEPPRPQDSVAETRDGSDGR